MLKRTLMFLVALTLIEGYWKAVERAIDGYVTTRPVDLVIGVTWAALFAKVVITDGCAKRSKTGEVL